VRRQDEETRQMEVERIPPEARATTWTSRIWLPAKTAPPEEAWLPRAVAQEGAVIGKEVEMETEDEQERRGVKRSAEVFDEGLEVQASDIARGQKRPAEESTEDLEKETMLAVLRKGTTLV